MYQSVENVLVIGDTHIPFVHRDYLEFCLDVKKEFKCNKVVHIGDLCDQHSINFHEHHPDGKSSGDEVSAAKGELVKWYKAFPEVWICKGNHDVLPYRRAIQHGISRKYLKSMEQMWEFPVGWVCKWDFQYQGVIYQHGTGYSGKLAHLSAAEKNRRSTVIGHCHSIGGSNYLANSKDLIFGMSVGCGIDRKKYAFAYGKDFKDKPILGCGVVRNGREGHFIPMLL